MAQLFRFVTLLFCVLSAVLCVGFSTQQAWAVSGYPWPDGRLSYIWLGSIFAAYALPLGWLVWSGEQKAAWPGYVSLSLTAFGLGWLFNEEMFRQQLPYLGSYAHLMLATGIAMGTMAGIAYTAVGSPDPRLTPLWIRYKVFVPIILIELLATALLLWRYPYVFPWPLKPATSLMMGLIFLGSGCYHSFVLLYPSWHYAKGQLLGFVGYGAVLTIPYLAHFGRVKSAHLPSLIAFFTIIVVMNGVACYALFQMKKYPV
jgi:hypothetical protein